MPNFRAPILNLLGGVSQQPTHLRQPNQAQRSENFIARAERGLMKRPNTEHVKIIASSSLSDYDNVFIHSILRNASEQYRILLFDGSILAFDADGNAVTVRTPDGTDYLSSALNPRQDFRAATIGDTTVITNRQVTTAKTTERSPLKVYEALLYVRDADFDVNYTVTLDGVVLPPVRTLSNDDPASMDSINTTSVASLLVDNINDNGSGFVATQYGSAVHVERTNAADFSIVAEDGLGGEGLIAIKGKAQRFEDLPPQAPDGFTVEITGDPTTGFDNFWVSYSDSDAIDEQGIWNETVAPNEQIAFDPSTMPHELVRNGVLVPEFEALNVLQTPDVSVVGSGSEESETFATSLNGSGSNPQTLDVDGGFAYANVTNANGLSTLYTITFDGDFSTIGSNTVTLTVSVNDGVASTNWTTVQTWNFYQADGNQNNRLLTFTTAALDAGYDVRVGISYADTPEGDTDLALVNLKTLTFEPATTDAQVDFGASELYPEGTTVTITVNGNDVDYVVTGGDETGTEVAVGIQPDLNAEPDITATITSAGVVKLEDAGGTPTVVASTDFDSNKQLITSGFGGSITDDDLIGDVVENITDNSTMTITDNTDKTLVGSAGLTGGTNNTFSEGDVCRIVGTGTYFVFREATWASRAAGNTTTNPFPSFTEKEINDVFWYKNRLGFLSGENCILSRTNAPFTFFRSTVTDLLDTAPIDIEANNPESSDLTNTIHWNKELIVQSDRTDFVLRGEPLLSPKTARLPTISGYGASRLARPVVIGDSMYFLKEQENNTHLYRYRVSVDEDREQEQPKAEWLNEHAPTYMPGAPVCLLANEKHGFVAIITSDDQSKVFLYKYTDNSAGNRLQSAWQTWQFYDKTHYDPSVIGIDILDDSMGLVVQRQDDVSFELARLDPTHVDTITGVAYPNIPILLDRRITDAEASSISYDGGDDETTITLPYMVKTEVLYESLFTDLGGTLSQNHTPVAGTNLPAFPTAFDNGDDNMVLYSNNFSLEIKTPGESFAGAMGIRGVDPTVGGGGIAMCGVTPYYDDFTIEGVFRLSGHGQWGLVFRSDDAAADNRRFWMVRVHEDIGFSSSTMYLYYFDQDEFGSAVPLNLPLSPTIFQDWEEGDTVLLRATVFRNGLTVQYSEPNNHETLHTLVEDLCLPSPRLTVSSVDGETEVTFDGYDFDALNNPAQGSFGFYLKQTQFASGNAELDYLRVYRYQVSGFAGVVNRETGAEIPVIRRPSMNQIVVSGDYTSTDLYLGVQYSAQHELSKFHRRHFDELGQMYALTDGRLQVKRLWLDFEDAREFDVDVEATRSCIRRLKTTSFADSSVATGRDSADVDFTVPVLYKNSDVTITIRNDSPFQSRFQSGQWLGSFNRRNARGR